MYIWINHNKDVTKKTIPKISFRIGIMGFVYAYFNYKLNIVYYYYSAKYLALNYVNFLLTYLLPFHLVKKPASVFLLFSSSTLFNYSPYLTSILIASTIASFAFLISDDFLALGLCLN